LLRAGRYGDRIPLGAILSALIQIGSEAHPAFSARDTWSFPGGKGGRGVVLVTHSHLVPRFTKKSGAVPLFSLRGLTAYNRMEPSLHFTSLHFILLNIPNIEKYFNKISAHYISWNLPHTYSRVSVTGCL
jgi:hypothetical protein